MLNSKKFSGKKGYIMGLIIALNTIIIVGLCIGITQVIAQWVNLGAIIVCVNMWNGNVITSSSLVLFVCTIIAYIAMVVFFVRDLFREIYIAKKLANKTENF